MWSDVTAAVLEIAANNKLKNQQPSVDDGGDLQPLKSSVAVGRPPEKKKRKGAVSFIPDSSDEEDEGDFEDPDNLEEVVNDEVKRYQLCKGCSLRSDDGSYVCPLSWWKLNHKSYPNIGSWQKESLRFLPHLLLQREYLVQQPMWLTKKGFV